MFCLSSINEEPPQAQQNGEDHEGPSPKRAKDFFSSLKKVKRSDKTEAEMYLEDPSDSFAQLDSYPTIRKMYRYESLKKI